MFFPQTLQMKSKKKKQDEKGITHPDYNQSDITCTNVKLINWLLSNLSYIYKECLFHLEGVSKTTEQGL